MFWGLCANLQKEEDMTSAISEGGQDLIELLDRFNRKEPYFLICEALGLDKFSLSEECCRRLESVLGVPIPTDARVWMDYHMNWLAAAVIKWHEPSESDVYSNTGLVRGNPEDVDLLVAFEEGGHYRLVCLLRQRDTNPGTTLKHCRKRSAWKEYSAKMEINAQG